MKCVGVQLCTLMLVSPSFSVLCIRMGCPYESKAEGIVADCTLYLTIYDQIIMVVGRQEGHKGIQRNATDAVREVYIPMVASVCSK